MTWRTYLVMFFGTEDGNPSKIVKALEKVGLASSLGPVDFIYEWLEKPTKEEVILLADKIADALRGTGCVFNIDTHD
jgi:hypothetical protein